MIKELLSGLLNLGSEFIADKDKKNELEAKIKELENNFSIISSNNNLALQKSNNNKEVKKLLLDNEKYLGSINKLVEVDTQQNELNSLQLQNEDLFISRARPFAIYALVCSFVLHPLLVLVLMLIDFNIDSIKLFIDYSFDAITASVFGILGLGVLRTFDKRQKNKG